ncbi:hypothetical protein RND81_10G064500 [Saponaria officinalis]|uniref:Uncharacterized protein n=1 Tax=Saponaria officinalis TaxID=3572 RepID=A0AAW1HZ36_SAPOF
MRHAPKTGKTQLTIIRNKITKSIPSISLGSWGVEIVRDTGLLRGRLRAYRSLIRRIRLVLQPTVVSKPNMFRLLPFFSCTPYRPSLCVSRPHPHCTFVRESPEMEAHFRACTGTPLRA